MLSVALLLLGPELAGRADDKAAENARARLEAARAVYKGIFERRKVDAREPLDFEKLYLWSRRWMEAEKELAARKAERAAAAQGHVDRMKGLEELAKKLHKEGFLSAVELPAAEFYRLEAERWLEKEKAD
jgi:hypothetical protein